jgi:hypothetical protein
MVDRSQLQEGMPVLTHRGEKLGHVVEVTEEEFIVEKRSFLWRKDYAVPLEGVREVVFGEVHLSHGPDSLLFAPRELSRGERKLH